MDKNRAVHIKTPFATSILEGIFLVVLKMGALMMVLAVVLGPVTGCGDCQCAAPGSIHFEKEPTNPVWSGSLTAGDPSIIRVGDSLLMHYTTLIGGPSGEQLVIGVAKSSDGINWKFAGPNPQNNPESIALPGDTASWDKFLETAHVEFVDNEYLMYYSGYPVEGETLGKLVPEAEIGVARSVDGKVFERFLSDPILKREANLDNDALYSPTIVKINNVYHMIYTGWCLDNCNGPANGIGLLGATSPDGLTWTKQGSVFDQNAVTWGTGAIETELVQGPDGIFYLFFTSDITDQESAIGVARSDKPFGPWEIYPMPVLSKTQSWEGTGPIAPAVIIEDDRVRIWYMGPQENFAGFAVGYAEAPFPFNW